MAFSYGHSYSPNNLKTGHSKSGCFCPDFISPLWLSCLGKWVTKILDLSPRKCSILPIAKYNQVHQLRTTIRNPTSSTLFKIQTSLDFRSPLYILFIYPKGLSVMFAISEIFFFEGIAWRLIQVGPGLRLLGLHSPKPAFPAPSSLSATKQSHSLVRVSKEASQRTYSLLITGRHLKGINFLF